MPLNREFGDWMSLVNCLRVFREIKDNRKINFVLLAEKTNLSVKEIKRAIKYLQASDMISEVNSKIKINVKRLNEVS
ncbi:MAG: hypothetical protein ABH986_04665 [archaeon]